MEVKTGLQLRCTLEFWRNGPSDHPAPDVAGRMLLTRDLQSLWALRALRIDGEHIVQGLACYHDPARGMVLTGRYVTAGAGSIIQASDAPVPPADLGCDAAWVRQHAEAELADVTAAAGGAS